MTLQDGITTTAGELFSNDESAKMAALIYKRFGNDLRCATKKWRELLNNQTMPSELANVIAIGQALFDMDQLDHNGYAYSSQEYLSNLVAKKDRYLADIEDGVKKSFQLDCDAWLKGLVPGWIYIADNND